MQPSRMPLQGNAPYHISALLIITAFVAYKWQYLGLPLYWDEAWVYGPAVKTMHTHGPSLLPNTIGVELSRGHPLLFHFMAAVWTSCFSASNFSLHLFALSMAVALLSCTYMIGTKLGSPLIGLAAVSMVGVNEIFLAQSSLLLPEMALALSTLLAIWMFTTKNRVGYVIAASCALLIKESAIVLILAAFCWHVLSSMLEKGSKGWSGPVRSSLIILAPILPIGLFLFYQRLIYGWFFFPVHLGLISWDIKDIHYLFKFGYREVFEQQGMIWATMAFGLIAPLAWRGWKHRYTGVLVALIYVTAIKVLDGKWTLSPLPTLVVTLVCFALILRIQFMAIRRQEDRIGEFLSVSLIFVLGFLFFSALNFFSDRYLLCLIPIVALSFSSVLFISLKERGRILFPVCVAVIAFILFSNVGKDGHVGDTRLSYADDIRVHQELIQACGARELQRSIIFGSFMDGIYMTDPAAGYLNGQKRFEHITDSLGPEVTYAIVTQATPEEMLVELNAQGFEVVKRSVSGPAWGELLERRPE